MVEGEGVRGEESSIKSEGSRRKGQGLRLNREYLWSKGQERNFKGEWMRRNGQGCGVKCEGSRVKGHG